MSAPLSDKEFCDLINSVHGAILAVAGLLEEANSFTYAAERVKGSDHLNTKPIRQWAEALRHSFDIVFDDYDVGKLHYASTHTPGRSRNTLQGELLNAHFAIAGIVEDVSDALAVYAKWAGRGTPPAAETSRIPIRLAFLRTYSHIRNDLWPKVLDAAGRASIDC